MVFSNAIRLVERKTNSTFRKDTLKIEKTLGRLPLVSYLKRPVWYFWSATSKRKWIWGDSNTTHVKTYISST